MYMYTYLLLDQCKCIYDSLRLCLPLQDCHVVVVVFSWCQTFGMIEGQVVYNHSTVNYNYSLRLWYSLKKIHAFFSPQRICYLWQIYPLKSHFDSTKCKDGTVRYRYPGMTGLYIIYFKYRVLEFSDPQDTWKSFFELIVLYMLNLIVYTFVHFNKSTSRDKSWHLHTITVFCIESVLH